MSKKRNKKKKRNKRISFWSIVVGLGVGYFIGWYLDGLLPINFEYLTLLYYVIPMLFFGYLGYMKPTFTEYVGFATAGWILFQYIWDYKVLDRGPIRLELFIIALVLLSLNLFTGKVKWKGAIKTFKNAIGLK